MTNLLTPQEVLQALTNNQDVEYRNCMGEWCDLNLNTSCIRLLINKSVLFRIKLEKQETITVGDVSFPKPYQGEMLYKQEYYYPIMDYTSLFGSNTWECDRADLSLMKKGLVHLTKENAIAHAKALIKLSGGEICQS